MESHTFLEHTRIVVANRNVHRHEFSCECGAKGKIGCRYNMPMGHNINNTRLVQLIPKNQCHITQSSTTTTSADNNEAQRGWSIRCPVCYAKGAAQDCNLTCVEITAAMEEEDALRKLHVEAIPPEPTDGTRDERVMACELARPNISVPQE